MSKDNYSNNNYDNNGRLLSMNKYNIILKVHLWYLKYWLCHKLCVSAAEVGKNTGNSFVFCYLGSIRRAQLHYRGSSIFFYKNFRS